MKRILFLILAMMMIPTVQAYDCWKGNTGTNKDGQYGTFDSKETFVPDASIVPCEQYQAWVKAQPTPETQYEEKLVATTGLDPATQAAISAATGAGAAYLVVRRKKPQPP